MIKKCTRCGAQLTEKEVQAMWIYDNPACFKCCWEVAFGAPKAPPALAEFEETLKRHDWTYQYAESGEEYRKGAREAAEIRKTVESYSGAQKEEAETLYRNYYNKKFRRG